MKKDELNDRQSAISEFIKQKKSAGRAEIQDFAGKLDAAAKMTILRDLEILIKNGR